MNRTAGILLAVLVVGGIIWFLSADRNLNNTALLSPGSNATSTASGNVSAGGQSGAGSSDPLADGNRVLLREATAGNSVVIQSAALTEPGYVVIYRSETDGETQILGRTQLLQRGEHNNITVNLSSAIENDQSVVAVLHRDDGDGSFEVPGDDTYLGNPGSPIVNDADVVGTSFENEPAQFESQVETYLEENATTTAQ